MRSRLRALDPTGQVELGILPTIGIRVSAEVGGAGSVTFDALRTDLDTHAAADAVLRLELEDAGTWVPVGLYAMRPPYERTVTPTTLPHTGTVTAAALCETWAGETVILPEYAAGTMPAGAGTDRGIGWMSSSYDPATDPREPWDGCYNTARTTTPAGWPTASGAKWISVTGATDSSERKLFRATLDLSGETAPQLLRAWLSSDESATLWVAGEPIIETSSVETGRDTFDTADLVATPGRYAVAVDTATDFTKGGDGVDPIIVAVAVLDDNGTPDRWVLVTDSSTWVACRRDDEPPDNEPPGPTPGAVIGALLDEAAARGSAGWAGVGRDFTATTDSYGVPWPAPVIERQVRYAFDGYWAVWSALAETDETDVWFTGDLVAHAAPTQGRTLPGPVLDATIIGSARATSAADPGTWCAALSHDGWTSATAPGQGMRREYGLELGTARSRAVADRIIAADLAHVGRVDITVSKWLPLPGARPMLDVLPGDRVPIAYCDVTGTARILSFAATAGDGGLLWEAELEVTP
jgi:hypothetical protein